MKHMLACSLFASCLLLGSTYADDSEDFVALYNKGQREDARTKVKGYADPRLFKSSSPP